MNTLRSRLFLAFALVIGIVVVAISLALLLILRNSRLVDRAALPDLARVTRLMQRANPPPADASLDSLQRYVNRAAGEHDARILLAAGDGRVLVDSEAGGQFPLRVENALEDPISRLAYGRIRADSRVWLYTVRPIENGYRVVVAVELPETTAWLFFRQELLEPIGVATLIGLGVALVLVLALARWVASPLADTAAVASQIARGDFSRRAGEGGPAEVAAVGRALNSMATQIQSGQQTLRDFVSDVSHEMKTPLTSIQGFAQAITDGAAEKPAEVRRSAAIIQDEAARLNRLVVDLLDLAKLEGDRRALKREPVDLRALLLAQVERAQPRAAGHRHALSADLDPGPLTVAGDADRLVLVFRNLIDNALKYTPDGGRVVVTARKAAGTVEVAVADSGPGIPPEDLPRVFDRFYRVDKSRARTADTGSGLGLAIVREIVTAHGGRVKAESVVGLGSKFTVSLRG
jgi:signal transduction histidine kinase